MATELFASNLATTNVTSGGTTAPASGTSESWTVASSAMFPAAVTNVSQFHVADAMAGKNSEMILVTNVSGTTWTVTRGAENTVPVTHAAGFTIFQVTTTGALNQLFAVDWLNVATMFGADPTNTTDSTTAINNALSALPAGGGTVYFPIGTYKVSGALNVPTGATLQGAGQDISIISQTSTSADTLAATDKRYITVRDLQLTGPSSGSGRGIAFLHSAATVASINLENLIVQNFGGDGVHLETVITSALLMVRSQSNGGHGFLVNSGTSVSFKACYANANTGNGYEIDSMNYMQLDGCAADACTIGYSVNGSSAVVLNGCGSETCADGFKVLGASANIVLQGCKVQTETAIGFWVTGNSVFCFLLGCREASPNGATASFQVDSGSAAIVIDPQNTTANNYSAGTVCLFQPTNLEIHSSSSAVARVSRGATSNTGRYTLQTGNSDRWTFGLSNDSTDNLHITDLGHTTDAVHVTYQTIQPNIGLLGGSTTAPTYGGGAGTMWLANASTIPTSNPAGGGLLYSSAGTLYWLGSAGTFTKIANA